MNDIITNWKNLTLDNLISIVSLIFVFFGGIFTFVQWRKSIKIKRAEFLYQILEKLRSDKDLAKTMNLIDYNQNWYDKSFHRGKMENSIDNLFSYVDYICYLKSIKNISTTEFRVFKYKIDRICISISSQKYLWNLYHFSVKNKTNCSFQFLIDYGINHKIFPDNFKENKNLYEKTLHW